MWHTSWKLKKTGYSSSEGWWQGEVFGFRFQGSGFRVQGSGFRVQGSGFRVQGSGFRGSSPAFWVSDSRSLSHQPFVAHTANYRDCF